MTLWLTIFALSVLGALALACYCMALLLASRSRPSLAVVASWPPAVETPVSPVIAPPPAVPPDAFSDDDAETAVSAPCSRAIDPYESTALARPYALRPTEARTVVRSVIAYRPPRIGPSTHP
jgi:hypothetical protein